MNMKALWGMPMSLNSARISVVVIAAITSQALASERTEMNPLVEANTAFALQLYGKLRSTEGNLALSPYSISSALAMTYAGAQGDRAHLLVAGESLIVLDYQSRFRQEAVDAHSTTYSGPFGTSRRDSLAAKVDRSSSALEP